MKGKVMVNKAALVLIATGWVSIQSVYATEQWREVGEMLMSRTYVDMNTVKIEKSGKYSDLISYTNKLVSKSDNSGIVKNGYMISDVIDNCKTHEQTIFNVRIFNESGKKTYSDYGGGEPIDTSILKSNSAQYQAHFLLCSELIKSALKPITPAKAEVVTEKVNAPSQLDTAIAAEITETAVVPPVIVKPKADTEISKDIQVDEHKPDWVFIDKKKNISAELDKNSLTFNTTTQRATYIIKYLVEPNANDMFKSGESMLIRSVSDCSNGMLMKLSATKFDLSGKESNKKIYQGKDAKFEKVRRESLLGSVHDYVCNQNKVN